MLLLGLAALVRPPPLMAVGLAAPTPRCAAPILAERSPEVQARIEEMAKKNQQNGVVVLGTILTICVWLFTVPPDIRRTNICGLEGADPFIDNCKPVAALVDRIGDHYATCGRTDSVPCVAFDFSIDPRSRAAFDARVEALTTEVLPTTDTQPE